MTELLNSSKLKTTGAQTRKGFMEKQSTDDNIMIQHNPLQKYVKNKK